LVLCVLAEEFVALIKGKDIKLCFVLVKDTIKHYKAAKVQVILCVLNDRRLMALPLVRSSLVRNHREFIHSHWLWI